MWIYKTLFALAAVALGVAAVLAFPGFSPEVEASAPAHVVKADRLDYRPIGKACTQQAWPYYEIKCLRDRAQVAGEARTLRLITTDRLAAK